MTLTTLTNSTHDNELIQRNESGTPFTLFLKCNGVNRVTHIPFNK